ncbi:MAG TPA: FAD-dependent oxidoreductase, partial [Gemmataceae bacterium]|nr:FAD-dependent oxidoreductase [Gemmataceae bacterium]
MTYDIAIVGGGIIGLGTALALVEQTSARIVVLEAEGRLAAHQTGHNSGVIHSGLYYKPGSLKAKNCAEGRDLMYRYCADNGIPHERCGKVVVATSEQELPALTELEHRGTANGLVGLRRLGPEEVRE